MNALNFKKHLAIKSVVIIFSLFGLSNVYAQGSAVSGNHDGGLMKQMMNEQYQPKVISAPEAQIRLRSVDMTRTSHQSGGLMKQMTLAKYQPKTITDPDAQSRLRKIVIEETAHQNGGLMKQMRQQLMQADFR